MLLAAEERLLFGTVFRGDLVPLGRVYALLTQWFSLLFRHNGIIQLWNLNLAVSALISLNRYFTCLHEMPLFVNRPMRRGAKFQTEPVGGALHKFIVEQPTKRLYLSDLSYVMSVLIHISHFMRRIRISHQYPTRLHCLGTFEWWHIFPSGWFGRQTKFPKK